MDRQKHKHKDNPESEFQEDWNRFDGIRENPDDKPNKFMKMPKRYETNFLAKMDSRTHIFHLLNNAYKAIMSDLGGQESLSHIQLCLVERFVFLEFVLKSIEHQIVTEPKKKIGKLINRWIYAINCLTGLGKTVGLERRAKKIANLQSYIKGKTK